jgi:hypothetical protein
VSGGGLKTRPEPRRERSSRIDGPRRLPLGQATAFAAVLLSAGLVWWAPGAGAALGEQRGKPFAADSYTTIVNQLLVPADWLTRVDDPATGLPRVALTRDAERREPLLKFIRNSYLGEDLAANDPDLWLFAGSRVVGLNPTAHNLTDPFVAKSRWTGDLLFREDGSAGPRNRLPVLTGERGQAIALAPRGGEPQPEGLYRIAAGTSEGDLSHGFEFLDPDNKSVAKVWMMGNRAVVTLRCHLSRTYDIAVFAAAFPTRTCPAGDGDEETGGSRLEKRSYALVDGDTIEFRLRGQGRSLSSFRVGYGGSALSEYRPFGPRSNSDSAGGFGEDFARGMDWASAAIAARHGTPIGDVDLTLSRRLQDSVDSTLLGYIGELRKDLGRDENDIFPAAVSILDASNGEVLALGSYPERSTLETRWEARTSSIWRNQNFVALPIGSAAKVPIASAILSRFPDLRFLCIEGTHPDDEGKKRFHRILGAAVNPPIYDGVGQGLVDFNRFLRNSSNRYAAALMMLAATRQGSRAGGGFDPVTRRDAWPLDPLDRFVLGGPAGGCAGRPAQELSPSYVFPLVARPAAGGAGIFGTEWALPLRLRESQNGESWVDWLERLFAMRGVAAGAESTFYDPAPWQPMLGYDDDAYRYLAAVSPDRPRLGLQSVQNINDYLMIILGGGSSRWTSLKLAEAYSRLAMEREVIAHFRPQASLLATDFFRPVPDEARSALLEGMRQAAQSGTASRLGAAARSVPVPAGQEIRIFAKTGTPSLETPVYTPTTALLDLLIRKDVVAMTPGGELAVPGRRPGESEPAAIQRLGVDRYLNIASAAAARAWSRARMVNRFRRSGRNPGLVFDAAGKLVGIRPDALKRRSPEEAPEGGVVAFVIGRYCHSDARSLAPLRALTVVVNVQARTAKPGSGGKLAGPNPAVEVGVRLLGDKAPAVREWLLEGGGSNRCSV